jgi:hypothetical protein
VLKTILGLREQLGAQALAERDEADVARVEVEDVPEAAGVAADAERRSFVRPSRLRSRFERMLNGRPLFQVTISPSWLLSASRFSKPDPLTRGAMSALATNV